MVDLIYGIDISNYQAYETQTVEAMSALLDSLGAQLGTRPQHVVVRAGLSCESPRLRQIAIAQLQAAVACGCTVSMYGWGYATYPAESVVADMMSQAQEAGVQLAVYWVDLEDSPPVSYQWIVDFVAACQANGITYYGIYSGKWWFDQSMPGVDLSGVWLWDANYNGSPNLSEPSYANMVLVAHQYSDRAPDGSGLDMDVFHPMAAGLPIPDTVCS